MARLQVEEIKEKLDILEVIGGYVELHKAGRHYKGKSPFTNEKTPSFFVSPDRGMYYCFSSQKGGDVFTFIEEIEGVDFKGALKILADRAGVELVPEDPQKRDAREAQYALLNEAATFFFKTREEHRAATDYVTSRGVKGETMHAWRIGYAPDEWRALRSHLHPQKFTDEQILSAGLIKRADGGKEPYDVFRDRIMFPISDASGRVVAFSGRTLKSDDSIPKYVNSPETELFQKSEVLYGYDKARQGIRQYDFSLVVEGQFDLVLAHQAGYTNTVAVSGTALTPQHVGLLSRLSQRVVLALDADRAGIAAVKRSSELMLEKGMDVKVAQMPEGEDPADIIKEDKERFKRIVGSAPHVINFLLDVLKRQSKDERAYKLRTREEILPLLLKVANRIDREHFEGIVADATGTTRDAIHYELERMAAEGDRGEEGPVGVSTTGTQLSGSRKEDLIRYLSATETLLKEEHTDLAQQIGFFLKETFPKEELDSVLEQSKDALNKMLFTTETYFGQIPLAQQVKELSEHMTELSHIVARERLKALRQAITEAERAGEEAKLIESLEATKQAEMLLQNTIFLKIDQ